MEQATTTAIDTESTEAYCPHCFLLIESDARGSWPPRPTRCQHCKLMIGPGRARVILRFPGALSRFPAPRM